MIFEHLDMRLAPVAHAGMETTQTVGSLLTAKVAPVDEHEQEEGKNRLAAHDGDILIRDCTVDADMPVALDNAALILISSDVRGFGRVTWAEIAVRRSALGGTRTALLSVFDGPLIVSATCDEKPHKRDDELAATRAVAHALNKRRGTSYVGEPSLPETWEDGFLRSRQPGEPEIPVQIRQFSDDLARLLRGPSRGVLNHGVGILGKLLQSAIDKKTNVDTDARRKAYLVLLSPVALGAIKRTEIAALQLDPGGYSDVWLYPVGEEAYSLIAG